MPGYECALGFREIVKDVFQVTFVSEPKALSPLFLEGNAELREDLGDVDFAYDAEPRFDDFHARYGCNLKTFPSTMAGTPGKIS